MDLEKEYFMPGKGDEYLTLVFTEEIARDFIFNLKTRLDHRSGDFYYSFSGKVKTKNQE